MREINSNDVKKVVQIMVRDACTGMSADAECALKQARTFETSERARFAIDSLLENARIAKSEIVPLCQDTGMAVFFVDIGQDVHVNGSLTSAINSGVALAYTNGLRASVLDPITRINTGDNRPAIINYNIVEGDSLRISFMPKGFGSENMSKLYMLFPSAGEEGIVNCVVDAAKSAGACPCPPYVIGVGIGGTADKAMSMAKHALMREIGSGNVDNGLIALENEILDKVNALHIGASGFGGNVTALEVHIEKFPTHIAGLPVAVNFGCNAMRRKVVTL